MLRALAMLGILALLGLDLWLPRTMLGRRGNDQEIHTHVASVSELRGKPFPDFELEDLSGRRVRLSDLRGHRVLLTFERSLDW